ncbi:tyrosine-type recombinase/integrase [Clostridiaceae bacterium 35-E11]
MDPIQEQILSNFLSRFKKEKTKQDYRRDIINFTEFIEKDYLEADMDNCKAYIEHLAKKMDEKKIARTTAEKLYSQIYSFFNYLEINEHIAYNHLKKISKPTATRVISKEKIVTWEELDKIISVLKTYNLRDFAALMLIFTSGLTLSETVNLKWNQFVIDKSGNIGIILKLRHKERYVKVHKDIWNLLKDYKTKNLKTVGLDSYVFLNNRGTSITGRWLRMVLKQACIAANIHKEYTPRDLRHAFAAYTLKNGASSEQVKEQLGWSTENLAKRYLYAIQDIQDNAVDYLNFSLKSDV